MALELASEEGQPGADAPGEAPPGSPPRDEAKRERAKKKQAAKRLLQKAAAADTEEEVWEIFSKLAERNGKTLQKPEAAAPEQSAPAAPTGVPSSQQIAQAMPMTMALWNEVALQLEPTPFHLREGKPVRVPRLNKETGELTFEVVKVDKVAVLAEGTAPLCAQVMGKMAAPSPLIGALVTVGMVFGPTAISLASQAAFGWWKRRKAKADETAAAAPPAAPARKAA